MMVNYSDCMLRGKYMGMMDTSPRYDNISPWICPCCHGEGKIENRHSLRFGTIYTRCETCNGTGQVREMLLQEYQELTDDILDKDILEHKCSSPECKNGTTSIWCKECLTKLGNFIEQNPIGVVHKKQQAGKYSMAHRFDFLDDFVEKMKAKILERDEKYGHKPTTEKEIREHLVDEILELYDLKPYDRKHIRKIFNESAIDKSELIDVANLCWILAYFMENPE